MFMNGLRQGAVKHVRAKRLQRLPAEVLCSLSLLPGHIPRGGGHHNIAHRNRPRWSRIDGAAKVAQDGSAAGLGGHVKWT